MSPRNNDLITLRDTLLLGFVSLRSNLSVISKLRTRNINAELIIQLSPFLFFTKNRKLVDMKDTCINQEPWYNIFFPLNIGSFAVLKNFKNIPKHS